jgi:UDP-GlcNAc:undecaprenyl-phosphate GlcNAc-1-phosphate transferase
MTTCIIGFLVALFVAVVATQGVRRMATHVGAVDTPDDYRKMHHEAVPGLGGLAIFVAFLVPVCALYFFNTYVFTYIFSGHRLEALGCVLGGATALAIGVADDLKDLRPRTKLLWQILPAAIAFSTGSAISVVSLPFVGSIHLGWLSFPITALWFLGCMNAVNFLDGLDGLAAGVILFVSLTLFLVGLMFNNVFSMVLMACLSGAILGFLVFNFHPARIFLGDSGSMLLGYLVAALSLMASRKAEAAVALLIPVVALGLPILDTGLAILRRWYKRLPLESADRQHIHHVLIGMGWSHRRAVFLLYAVCVALGLSALLITVERSEVTMAVLGVLLLMAFVCIRVFGRLNLGAVVLRLADDRAARHRASAAKVSVERSVQVMQRTADPAGMWEACVPALEKLGLDYARLHLNDHTYAWTRAGTEALPGDADVTDGWHGVLPLRHNGRMHGRLSVRTYGEENGLLPDTPQLVRRLSRKMTQQMERFLAAPGDAGMPEETARTGLSEPVLRD